MAVTAPVAVETAWMIESRLGPDAEAAFVTSIADDELAVIDLTPTAWTRCVELIARYADLGLGYVDASVIAVAERIGVTTIATLDHRNFTVVRPSTATPSTSSPEQPTTNGCSTTGDTTAATQRTPVR